MAASIKAISMYSLQPITLREARKRFEAYQDVYLAPNKMPPYSFYFTPCRINKGAMVSVGVNTDFDTIIERFKYYNCSKETGLRVSFYIEPEPHNIDMESR